MGAEERRARGVLGIGEIGDRHVHRPVAVDALQRDITQRESGDDELVAVPAHERLVGKAVGCVTAVLGVVGALGLHDGHRRRWYAIDGQVLLHDEVIELRRGRRDVVGRAVERGDAIDLVLRIGEGDAQALDRGVDQILVPNRDPDVRVPVTPPHPVLHHHPPTLGVRSVAWSPTGQASG